MNKILLIIKREYLTRVRKKSFLIMTLAGPLFFAFIMIIPMWFAGSAVKHKTVQVADESGYFRNRLQESPEISFVYAEETFNDGKVQEGYAGLLYIPVLSLEDPQGIVLFSSGLNPREKKYIESILSQEIFKRRLQESGINEEKLAEMQEKVPMLIHESETTLSYSETASALSIFLSVLIYFFIFLYGVQVMRGVLEEKSGRIVEVILSSVKPFQLMMGKIVGIALLSLTQFLIWVTLTAAIAGMISVRYGEKLKMFSDERIEETLAYTHDAEQAMEWNMIISAFEGINIFLILPVFLIYFLGGYLLYSAMFAAIGAVSDTETDTQQFMLPITLPLFFSFIVAVPAMQDPQGNLAFWLSMIPFTSPVMMMVRLPFEVPAWELITSIVLLMLTFIGATWVSAKIYRAGILMYGKKMSLKEIWNIMKAQS